jgi:hypothetical protein
MADSTVPGRRGQSFILVALMLPALLGMAAAALTVGEVYFAKTQLQNAVDAAALAGAQQLADNPAGNPSSQASLITSNDPQSVGGTVARVPGFPNQVRAVAREPVPGGIAGLFGVQVFWVGAAAVANYGPGQAFDWAIFQGSTSQTLYFAEGGNTVNGSVHSNQNIVFDREGQTVTGILSASGTLSPDPPASPTVSNTIGSWVTGAPYIPMPTWPMPTLFTSQDATVIAGNYTLAGGTVINGNLLVDGNLTIEGDVTVNGSIQTVNGSINFAGGGDTITGSVYADSGSITISGGDTVDQQVMAEGGNVTFEGGGDTIGSTANPLTVSAFPVDGVGGNVSFPGGNTFTGVVYAPGGTLTVEKGGNSFTGAVVALNQDWEGGSNTVTWSQGPVDNIPYQQVNLIQ